MFSSKSDEWETPKELFNSLNDEFHFTVDACATSENAKCAEYYDKQKDGLSQIWGGCVWCNPPYGKQIGRWVQKASKAAHKDGAKVVMLLPARTDTRWFHDYIYNKRNVEIRFLRGRLKFGGSKNSAPFPSMIVIFENGGNENGTADG